MGSTLFMIINYNVIPLVTKSAQKVKYVNIESLSAKRVEPLVTKS